MNCLKKKDENTEFVVEKTTEKVSSVKDDDLEFKEAFIIDSRGIIKPGLSTTVTRENSFEASMEQIGDLSTDTKGLSENEMCGGMAEEGVNEPRGKLIGSDNRRKGKATKDFGAAINLLATPDGKPDSCCERYENTKEKPFTRAEDDYYVTSIHANEEQYNQLKDKDLSPSRQHHENIPNATDNTAQDETLGKTAMKTPHYGVTCKGKVPEGVFTIHSPIKRKKKLQSCKASKAAHHLVKGYSEQASCTSNSSDPLCKMLMKKEARKQEKCFRKVKTGIALSAEDNQHVASWKEATSSGMNAFNCMNTTSTEARTNKNKELLICPRKETEGANTNLCRSDKYCCGKGVVAENCSVASTYKKKRNVGKVTEDGQSCHRGEVKSLKLKRHVPGSPEFQVKAAKKQRGDLQSVTSGPCSIPTPESVLLLKSSEVESPMTTDQTPSGCKNMTGGDSNRQDRKREGCIGSEGQLIKKETSTVDQFFDVFDGILFDRASSDQVPNERDHTHVHDPKEGATTHAQSERNAFHGATASGYSHGRLKVKWPVSKDRDSCTKQSTGKNHSNDCKNQLHNKASIKSAGKQPRYEQTTESSRNAAMTKGTFDLATVIYEGILQKCNVKSGGEACSSDDCRITCIKSKGIKEQGEISRQGKSTLKRSTAENYSTKEKHIDCAIGKASWQQGPSIDHEMAYLNSNRHESVLEVLNKPTTSRVHCFDGSTNSKETNGTNKDCHITCSEENRVAMVSQQISFTDEIFGAKPSWSGYIKCVKQTHVVFKTL